MRLVGVETHGAFLRAFWQNDNMGRFVNSMEGHRGPFWYYLATITGPAAVVRVPGSHDLGHEVLHGSNAGSRKYRRHSLSDWWAVVYLAFFSLAQTKLPNSYCRYFRRSRSDHGPLPRSLAAGHIALPAVWFPLGLWLLASVGVAIAAGSLIAGKWMPGIPADARSTASPPGPWLGLLPFAPVHWPRACCCDAGNEPPH